MIVYISAETLDDLMMKVLKKVLKSKSIITSTRGSSIEIDGVLLQLKSPRARLSRTEKKGTVFSCLGELLWYLSKGNDLDFIKYYIPKYEEESQDGKTVYGGYGPRLFDFRNNNQIQNVINLLSSNPNSRRAVIQLFDSSDISEKLKEIPCTCTLQFIIRNNKLHMLTNMRSNDAFIGLPHDIFCFTMIQEVLSRKLNVGLGVYKHFVGSLHLYEDSVKEARLYINEGWQEEVFMPEMPLGDPWPSIETVIEFESAIRKGGSVDMSLTGSSLNEYWKDIVRLLLIYKSLRGKNLKNVVSVKNEMDSDIYESYIRKKMVTKNSKVNIKEQLDLYSSDE